MTICAAMTPWEASVWSVVFGVEYARRRARDDNDPAEHSAEVARDAVLGLRELQKSPRAQELMLVETTPRPMDEPDVPVCSVCGIPEDWPIHRPDHENYHPFEAKPEEAPS